MVRPLLVRVVPMALVLAAPLLAGSETPISGGFTYQGLLDSNGAAVSGSCDLRFSLWNAPTDGDQIGAVQEVANTTVDRGTFTVTLDDAGQFGPAPFGGAERYLEIAVRCPTGSGAFATLAPRQRLTAVPYARYSLSSAAIVGQPISPEPPEPGQVLQWNGSAWEASTLSVGGRRRFYLGGPAVTGANALTACTAGFHMATIWELLDLSALRYDGSIPGARLSADMGAGPPTNAIGWMRTGQGSSTATTVPGIDNCAAWTSNNPGHRGSAASIGSTWGETATLVGPWVGFTFTCDQSAFVWCVED